VEGRSEGSKEEEVVNESGLAVEVRVGFLWFRGKEGR
jgi:hypothetical protein